MGERVLKSNILEFQVLWTQNKTQKRKQWHDGFLRFHTFNYRAMLYDDSRKLVDNMFFPNRTIAQADVLEFDRNLVEVVEFLGTQETDLSPLFARKKMEESKLQANTPARKNYLGRTPKHSENRIVTPTPHLSVNLSTTPRECTSQLAQESASTPYTPSRPKRCVGLGRQSLECPRSTNVLQRQIIYPGRSGITSTLAPPPRPQLNTTAEARSVSYTSLQMLKEVASCFTTNPSVSMRTPKKSFTTPFDKANMPTTILSRGQLDVPVLIDLTTELTGQKSSMNLVEPPFQCSIAEKSSNVSTPFTGTICAKPATIAKRVAMRVPPSIQHTPASAMTRKPVIPESVMKIVTDPIINPAAPNAVAEPEQRLPMLATLRQANDTITEQSYFVPKTMSSLSTVLPGNDQDDDDDDDDDDLAPPRYPSAMSELDESGTRKQTTKLPGFRSSYAIKGLAVAGRRHTKGTAGGQLPLPQVNGSREEVSSIKLTNKTKHVSEDFVLPPKRIKLQVRKKKTMLLSKGTREGGRRSENLADESTDSQSTPTCMQVEDPPEPPIHCNEFVQAAVEEYVSSPPPVETPKSKSFIRPKIRKVPRETAESNKIKIATQLTRGAPDFMTAKNYHAGAILALDAPIPGLDMSTREIEAMDLSTQLSQI